MHRICTFRIFAQVYCKAFNLSCFHRSFMPWPGIALCSKFLHVPHYVKSPSRMVHTTVHMVCATWAGSTIKMFCTSRSAQFTYTSLHEDIYHSVHSRNHSVPDNILIGNFRYFELHKSKTDTFVSILRANYKTGTHLSVEVGNVLLYTECVRRLANFIHAKARKTKKSVRVNVIFQTDQFVFLYIV